MKKYFFTAIACALLFSTGLAQEPLKPQTSPLAIVSAKYKDAYIKITYSRPHKRGREIFGDLVPFGEVWRTGANEATEITTTKDILVNAVLLKAGTYSLFTIPDRIKWTIIINQEVGLWGAYNYNPKLDVMRFDVPVESTGEVFEPLTMTLDKGNDKVNCTILWDRTKVTIPIRFITE